MHFMGATGTPVKAACRLPSRDSMNLPVVAMRGSRPTMFPCGRVRPACEND